MLWFNEKSISNTTHTAAVCQSMERIDIEGKLLASLYDVLIQINEFKVNSSDSNQLDEEHIGSVSTLSPHDNQLQLLKFQESRYLWERNRSTVYMWNER